MDLTREQRIERLQALISASEIKVKSYYEQWTTALMWDVKYERTKRVSKHDADFGILSLIPGLVLYVLIIVLTSNHPLWVLLCTVTGTVCAGSIVDICHRTTHLKHSPHEPAHYMPERRTLPDMRAVVASNLWHEWISDFRTAKIEEMNNDAILAYTDKHINDTLDAFIFARLNAFIKNN